MISVRKAFRKAFMCFTALILSLTVITVFPGSGTTAFAENFADGEFIFHSSVFEGSRKLACEHLIKGLENREEYIDFSEYGLTNDDFEDVFSYVMHTEPQFWYVDINKYRQNFKGDKLYMCAPSYKFTAKEQQSVQKKIDAYVADMKKDMKSSWSDAEKVLYVHDHIASTTEYSLDDLVNGRSVYDVFVKGRAVCVGYALAFQYLMEELDIPCRNVISSTHIWNMVKIGGKWYHVDVTWDDTIPDFKGQVSHEMLLLSDDGIRSTSPPHEKWVLGVKADSDKYANKFWRKSYTQIVPYDGKWYYSTKEGLYSYSFETNKISQKVEIKDKWLAENGTMVWQASFAVPVINNGFLYYNTPSGISKFDLKTGTNKKVKSYSLSDGQQIFGMYRSGDTLKIVLADEYMDGPDSEKKAFVFKSSAESDSGSSDSTDTGKLNVPENVSAVKKDGIITIKWSGTEDADYYAVYRYDPTTKKAVRLKYTEKTKFSFKASSKDNGCKYAVKAVKEADGKKIYSSYSEWVKY